MRTPSILYAAALASSATLSSAFAQDQSPPDKAALPVSHAEWIRGPNTLELVWPGYAFLSHMNGHVVLDCAINDKNKLKPCDVVEETPKGQGFTKAVLDDLEPTKMRPPIVDGAPLPGAHVRITYDFIGATGGIRYMWQSR